MQSVSKERRELASLGSRLQREEAECATLKHQLAEAQEAVDQERSKVAQLEGELVSLEMVKDGMSRELEKVGLGGCC